MRELKPGRSRGFTLVELMITVTVMAILVLAAAPSMRTWIFNTRVRTAAEALQNGLRQAQSEAVRRSRQVVFGLTNNQPGLNVTGTLNGRFWSAQTVPGLAETGGEFIAGGRLVGDAAGVTLTATPLFASALCFNSIGALVANTTSTGWPGVGCNPFPTRPYVCFDVSHASADRPLRVMVSSGGRIRMCDPARVFSAAAPDGCPAPCNPVGNT